MLTVGIALATVAFAVVDAVLFRALPYERPDELYVLRGENSATLRGQVPPVAAGEVDVWADALAEIPHTVVGATIQEFPIDGIGASLATIDDRFFDVLGVTPLMGTFTAEDFSRVDRALDRPVILSHRLWRVWTGGDRQIVGRRWVISEREGQVWSIRIAGVLPADFVFPIGTANQAPDLLAPISRLDRMEPRRKFHVIFRLGQGVEPASLAARLNAATKDLLAMKLPADPHGSHGEQKLLTAFDRATLEPLERWVSSRQRSSLQVLFAAALGLLLLACFNTAGLIGARNIERRGQLLMYRTLGASVRHLAALQVAEVLVLVAAAGAMALAAAIPILAYTVALLPESMILRQPPALDLRVIFAALGFSLACVLTISAAPLWGAATLGVPIMGAGKHMAVGARRRRAGAALLSVQIACGFVLLIGGVLTIASFGVAISNEAGYSRDRMIMVEASVRRYGSPDHARQQLEDAVTMLRGLPGIDRVAVSTIQANFLRPIITPTVLIPEGWTKPLSDTAVRQVDESFFEVMGLRLVAGRWPGPGEWDADSVAAIVSASAARTFWPDGRAVGRTLQVQPSKSARTVIGVVGDARFAGLDTQPTLDVYLPGALALGRTGLLYHLRTLEPPETQLSVVLREVSAKGLRVDRFATHSAGLFESVKDRALPAWLFGFIGASALVILAVGVGGLLAMVSAQRTREVGIRLALGSTPSGVVVELLREPFASVVDGLFVGAVASWWLVTFLESQLYGVGSHHPGLWAIAAVTLVVVATVAASLPAIRAAKVNPVETLRTL